MRAKEFVRNKNWVRIKKCCASCAHIAYGKGEDQRICKAGEGLVRKDYLCEDWELNKARDGIMLMHFGRVKKAQYLEWMKNQASEITKMDIDGAKKLSMLQALPKKYEALFGSRYMDGQK